MSQLSRNNFNKRRHLVQRIRMLMEAKPLGHGLTAKPACQVYAYIQQQGGYSLAELRDAVNLAEPVLLSQCPMAGLKEVDQPAGKTMRQSCQARVRLLSQKSKSCFGVKRRCKLSSAKKNAKWTWSCQPISE